MPEVSNNSVRLSIIKCLSQADNTSSRSELRRLFQTIRTLVEQRTKPESGGGPSAEHRDLPKQSVSAFCFLRFIVPAILHPHLFGLYPGKGDSYRAPGEIYPLTI